MRRARKTQALSLFAVISAVLALYFPSESLLDSIILIADFSWAFGLILAGTVLRRVVEDHTFSREVSYARWEDLVIKKETYLSNGYLLLLALVSILLIKILA
jgi:hypothetical protein